MPSPTKSQTPKLDARSCPQCKMPMTNKGVWNHDATGRNGVELWQCPICKNVEVLYP